MKSLATAKQRLAEALTEAQRSQLAEAMLRDVMMAATGVIDRIDVALVTGDGRARTMAEEFGFGVIEDARNESETAAIEMATAWCVGHGYDTTVVVPGDIPLITSAELHCVLDAAPEEGAVLVPAYDGRGSNCILRRPAAIIPLRFGNDSFLPHCEAMRKTGQELVILEMAGIGLDVDNPHELDLLVQSAGDTSAQQLLRSWQFDRSGRRAVESSGLMKQAAGGPYRGNQGDAGAWHSRRIRGRFGCGAYRERAGAGRIAAARGRHRGGQAQDRRQGGGLQGGAGCGEAFGGSEKFCASQRGRRAAD